MIAMFLAAGALVLATALPAPGQIRLLESVADPHGVPRPARGAVDVPMGTSLYFKLAFDHDDPIAADSVTVRLEADDLEPITLLKQDRRFADGVRGWLRRQPTRRSPETGLLAIYLEPAEPLRPATTYTVHVAAETERGEAFADGNPLYHPAPLSFHALGGVRRPAGPRQWTFTTEADLDASQAVAFELDLASPPIGWHGKFFSGICHVQFCTSERIYGPTHQMMHAARRRHPRAWSFQRDFWLTGTEHRRTTLFSGTLPNIVREKETRRITAMEQHDAGLLLHVDDMFGHEQYGVAPGRPLSEDYRAGYTVLIADGYQDASSEVLAVDDDARTVLVRHFDRPEDGWRLEYGGPLPEVEDPDAPGLFPNGGSYLRRFDPHGTAMYYWGRLDKEWDLVHGRYGRRVMPNFADAAGCLSRTGRSGYPPKDYVQWHRTVRDITGHIVDRYGDAALEFTWSVFNEPDLSRFWNANWNELLRFYDYTADGILRAFEDRGYDSDEVFIGGLELGGIFGANLKLRKFLTHCSPRAHSNRLLPGNAAYADPRLDGERSRRVETLCRAHGGRGSPLDFISIHVYNRSELAAEKFIAAKRTALEIDEAYYRELWISSHEACPEWAPPKDPAARDAYLGNGYFKTWTADVVARQLRQAAADERYAYGESIMTVWPPLGDWTGLNAVSRRLQVDDGGDGRSDRELTVPVPVFHVLTLLSDMGPEYWVLPQRERGGHVVSGFASRDERGTVRVLLYAHQALDTQSRGGASFDVRLDVRSLGRAGPARVTQYRFDRDHNSYFRFAHEMLDRDRAYGEKMTRQFVALLDAIGATDSAEARRPTVERLRRLVEQIFPGHDAAAWLSPLYSEEADDAQRREILALLRNVGNLEIHRPLSPEEAGEAERLAALHDTDVASYDAGDDSSLTLSVPLAANGLQFLVIEWGDGCGHIGRPAGGIAAGTLTGEVPERGPAPP